MAALSRRTTSTCAYSGNGSIRSRRRRISNIAVGDAPIAISRSSCATTSAYVKPPVPYARNTFSKVETGDDGDEEIERIHEVCPVARIETTLVAFSKARRLFP